MNKHYYEIEFFGEGHDKDLTYYIRTEGKRSIQGIKSTLEKDFLPKDSNLTKEHVENITRITEITKEEFEESCGVLDVVKCVVELQLPSGLKMPISFEVNSEEEAIEKFLSTMAGKREKQNI